jgi:hypothetical protein
MVSEPIYHEYDLEALGLLPVNWVDQILSVSKSDAFRTFLDGKSDTSREPAGIQPIEVHVVTGTTVKEKLPWLHELYHGKLLELASNFKEKEVFPSNDLESGVNINILRGKGSRYEWHVDANPVTGLLFVTTHKEGEGGELVFRLPEKSISVYPKSGKFIVFDAREIDHAVMPLIQADERISIPINFYFSNQAQERPDDLDEYLYTKS